MTALAMFASPTSIVVAGDGVTYNRDGNIYGPVTKIFPIPHLNAVVANTGIGGFATYFLRFLDFGCGSFDQLIEDAPDFAKQAYVRLTEDQGYSPPSTLLLAGYSHAEGQCVAYKIHSNPKEAIDQDGATHTSPAWEVVRVNGRYASTSPRTEDFERFGLDHEENHLDWTARVVCANRPKSKPATTDGDPAFGVGCHLQIAVVMADNVMTWIAHRWPDEIGLPINPSVGEAMPRFPLGWFGAKT